MPSLEQEIGAERQRWMSKGEKFLEAHVKNQMEDKKLASLLAEYQKQKVHAYTLANKFKSQAVQHMKRMLETSGYSLLGMIPGGRSDNSEYYKQPYYLRITKTAAAQRSKNRRNF